MLPLRLDGIRPCLFLVSRGAHQFLRFLLLRLSLCLCRHMAFSSPHKDTSHIALGPTLTTSP